ncbi:hypothetical protein [Streptobacillus ratti]|uniref:hypothetical protein n=1 Tax=Streptobacillus ratti TaxID=1720557 RepID=UPI000934B2E5|nr:hypothetical protein [Streptobacillus ratti]
MEKDKYSGLEHLLSTGVGIDYNKNYLNAEIKHSSDLRYVFGYVDKKPFSIINIWSDNKIEHKLNEKLYLNGEFNLTSSNRFRILNRNSKEDELLLLLDAKGILKYHINPKLTFNNKLEMKNIILFSYFPEETGVANSGAGNQSSQPSSAKSSKNEIADKLKIDSQYILKLYNESEIIYKIKDNIDIKGKLSIGYSQLKSDKLYNSLKDLKREQIDENGIREFSSKDIKIIDEETKRFNDENFLIATGIETEMRYIDDKLLIKPSLELGINHMLKIDISTEVPGLNNVNTANSTTESSTSTTEKSEKSETASNSDSMKNSNSGSNSEPTRKIPRKVARFSIVFKKIILKMGLNLEYRW